MSYELIFLPLKQEKESTLGSGKHQNRSVFFLGAWLGVLFQNIQCLGMTKNRSYWPTIGGRKIGEEKWKAARCHVFVSSLLFWRHCQRLKTNIRKYLSSTRKKDLVVWHTMELEKYTSGKTGWCDNSFHIWYKKYFLLRNCVKFFLYLYSFISKFIHQTELLQF